jgi:hypothetical protein
MKITKIMMTALALLFSLNANAHLLQYNLNLTTTYIEGSAFGDVTIGSVFQGDLAINTHELQAVIDDDGSDSNVVIMPLTTYDIDSDSDIFNMAYSFDIGDYQFTEETSGYFESQFTVDDYSNVEDVTEFYFSTGDDDPFHELDISYDVALGMGAWSATDADTGFVISGTVSAVPVPAAVWMFGSALFGLIRLKRKIA